MQAFSPSVKGTVRLVFMPDCAASIFHLSWFHKLLRHAVSLEQPEMPRAACGYNCIVYFSWIVSALTLAEWATFT